jgi:hypothetical protein
VPQCSTITDRIVSCFKLNHNHRLIFSEIYTKEGTKIIASSSSAGDPARIFETGDNPVSYGGTLWHFEDSFIKRGGLGSH